MDWLTFIKKGFRTEEDHQYAERYFQKKIKYGTLGITCVNSKWPAKWLTDNECCECNFECKIKVFEIKSCSVQ